MNKKDPFFLPRGTGIMFRLDLRTNETTWKHPFYDYFAAALGGEATDYEGSHERL